MRNNLIKNNEKNPGGEVPPFTLQNILEFSSDILLNKWVMREREREREREYT